MDFVKVVMSQDWNLITIVIHKTHKTTSTSTLFLMEDGASLHYSSASKLWNGEFRKQKLQWPVSSLLT